MIGELLTCNLEKYTHIHPVDGTLLHLLFCIEGQPAVLNWVQKLLMELYPVLQLRKAVIREYFDKTRHGTFTHEHPLKHINFQFLMNPKLICRMIEEG